MEEDPDAFGHPGGIVLIPPATVMALAFPCSTSLPIQGFFPSFDRPATSRNSPFRVFFLDSGLTGALVTRAR